MQTSGYRTGLWYVLAANLVWGLSPFLWRALQALDPFEIIIHRSLWSLPLVFGLLLIAKQWAVYKQLNVPTWLWLGFTSLLVAFNWLVFVWAIAHDRLLEASLGYFIYPLCTALLGVFWLSERLTTLQWAALLLASLGVLVLIGNNPVFPSVALALAFSFALYSLVRKQLHIPALAGLAIEIFLLFPVALLAAALFWQQREFAFFSQPRDWLVPLAGISTVLPLWWMTQGLKNLPLSHAGFIFYLNPTLQFVIAVFAFGEPIHAAVLTSFVCVWVATVLFFFPHTPKR